MPAIFNGESRERVKTQMMEKGIELIKRRGVKKTSVEEIAKTAGIAKGTFYNFFKSKEEFVFCIICYQRNKLQHDILYFIAKNGSLSRKDYKFLLSRIAFEDNLYAYLNEEDIAILQRSLPEETLLDSTKDEETITMILDCIPQTQATCDWRIVANYCKIIALTVSHRQVFNQDTFPLSIEILIDDMANYISGPVK